MLHILQLVFYLIAWPSCGVAAHRISSIETQYSGHVPDLGILRDRYELVHFLSEGGQAKVWSGYDRMSNSQVVIRFPTGLCDSRSHCRVEELHEKTQHEIRRSCSLASLANERMELAVEADSNMDAFLGVFSKCLVALSQNHSDTAFEIWSDGGAYTLAEGFFSVSPLGELSMLDKHRILEELKLGIRVLSDPPPDLPCCCRDERCSLKASQRLWVSTCPRGYRLEPESCGPIIHHDLKFDNVMLRRDKTGFVRPVIIDWGSAVLHSSASQKMSFTEDWVPFWHSRSVKVPDPLPWSYDSYAIGLMWLATELLSTLPVPEIRTSREAGVGSEETVRLAPAGFFATRDFLKDSIESVNVLVSDLQKHLLRLDLLSSSKTFVAAVPALLRKSKKDVFSEEVWELPLVKPSDETLHDIFPLLSGCPMLATKQRRSVESCWLIRKSWLEKPEKQLEK